MIRGDFHLHSNISDGIQPPATVMQRAAGAGLTIVALTDHDTTQGYEEASRQAAAEGITVLCGVEISTVHDGRDLHLLGLGLDPAEPALLATLDGLQQARRTRGHAIVERLAAAGAPVSIARVLEIAGHGSVGRPHVAHALVEAGWARDVDDAFSRWLSRGRPGHVAIEYLDAERAIALIHGAGGIAALAHPSLYREGLRLAADLAVIGLDAVEAVHPDVPPSDASALRALASEHSLLITGGSDDHGFDGKTQMGRSFLSGDDLDRLLQRLAD